MSQPLKRSPRECPLCGEAIAVEPLQLPGEASCPKCGHLLWFHKRTIDGVTILDVISGKAALSQEIDQISKLLIREGSVPQILINLADIQLVSSSFIAGLVAMHRRVTAAGGKLIVCQLSLVVRETLKGAKLDKMLDIADDEQEALARF
jgi:anti-anti-sigma factor